MMVAHDFQTHLRRLNEFTARRAAWLLLPFRPTSLRRWTNIIVLGAIGFIAAILFDLVSGQVSERLVVASDRFPTGLVAYSLIVVFAVLCVPLVRLGGLRRRHLLTCFVYPPTWTAAVLAAVALYGVQSAGLGSSLPQADNATWLYGVAILISSAALSLVGLRIVSVPPDRPQRPRTLPPAPHERGPRGFADDPDARLIPWLLQERPVSDPERDDFFELKFIARRVAGHFFDRTLSTVGLVGPFGVGKSSIINFVDYYLVADSAFRKEMIDRWRSGHQTVGLQQPPRILLCRVSAWGLRDQPAATVILRHAVERLAEEVDCLALSRLPERYAQALKGAAPEWLNMPLSLSVADDAAEQLGALDPVLEAIGARLVVVVEDLDRNLEVPDMTLDHEVTETDGAGRTRVASRVATGASGRVARELEALFSRLIALNRVAFVLAVARANAVELSRLCEYIEVVHRVERSLALAIVDELRAHALDWSRRQGDLQPASEDTLSHLGRLGEYGEVMIPRLGEWSVPAALAELLSTPRVLKQALRHTWEAWAELHGEIDFDDLLVWHVIRSASPDAFDVLIDSSAELSQGRLGEEVKADLQAKWDSCVRDCSPDERKRLWCLLGFLYPQSGLAVELRIPSPPQGIHRTVYWQRAMRGRVAERVRDQRVLHTINRWKLGDADAELPPSLATDVEFVEAFERVIDGQPQGELNLSGDELRRIARTVAAIGLNQHGPECSGELLPGFVAIWRCTKRKEPGREYEQWLWDTIEAALPCNLALANELESEWWDDRAESIEPGGRDRLRDRMLAWTKQRLTVECLVNNLGRTYPYALYHFVRREHMRPAPDFSASQWHWLIPRLIGAMDLATDTVTPQVCWLLIEIDTLRRLPGAAPDELPAQMRIDPLLSELVTNEADRQRLLAHLANVPDPDPHADPQHRLVVQGARDAARRLLPIGIPPVVKTGESGAEFRR